MLAQLQLNSVSRVFQHHDLRWDASSSPAIPGYILPGGQSYGLSLGEIDTFNIASGASKTWLLSMFAGQAAARISILNAAGTKTVRVTAAPQPPGVWGNTNWFSEYLPESGATGDNDVEFTMTSPRGPMAFTVENNDANNITVAFAVTAIEP